MCTICRSPIFDESDRWPLKCPHHFHKSCFYEWGKASGRAKHPDCPWLYEVSCPMCRRPTTFLGGDIILSEDETWWAHRRQPRRPRSADSIREISPGISAGIDSMLTAHLVCDRGWLEYPMYDTSRYRPPLVPYEGTFSWNKKCDSYVTLTKKGHDILEEPAYSRCVRCRAIGRRYGNSVHTAHAIFCEYGCFPILYHTDSATKEMLGEARKFLLWLYSSIDRISPL
jgi:hypothetical protein